METKANDVRRETEMREIGELLMQLTNMEEKVTAMRKSTVNDVSKVNRCKEQFSDYLLLEQYYYTYWKVFIARS